jgi:hypothetical protein
MVPYCPLRKGGGEGWWFWEGLLKIWSKIPFSSVPYGISGGMGRFVPNVMVVEREDATGAWYWKGLPTRNLVFERQMCAPSINHLNNALQSCCGN